MTSVEGFTTLVFVPAFAAFLKTRNASLARREKEE